MVTGIKHMAIAVADVEASLRAFQRLLGVESNIQIRELATAKTREAHFKIGGVEFQLCQSVVPDGRFAVHIREHGEGLHHICYSVPDAEIALAASLAAGAELKECAACKVKGAHRHSEGYVAFLTDKVAGIEIEFMQVYKPGEGPATDMRDR
ncbi:MAG: VOC family protein [Armatimonadetes bacterium]|nr:VOC family protein [Armatimonadota bacterium]